MLIHDVDYPDRWLVEDDVDVMAELTLWAIDSATARCSGFADTADLHERLVFARTVVADEADPVRGWQDGKTWPPSYEPGHDSPAIATAFAILALDSAHQVWAIRNGLTFGYMEWDPATDEDVEVLGSWDPIAEIRMPNDHPAIPLAGFLSIFVDYLDHTREQISQMSEEAIWGTSDPSLVDLARKMWPDFDGSVAELRASVTAAASP